MSPPALPCSLFLRSKRSSFSLAAAAQVASGSRRRAPPRAASLSSFSRCRLFRAPSFLCPWPEKNRSTICSTISSRIAPLVLVSGLVSFSGATGGSVSRDETRRRRGTRPEKRGGRVVSGLPLLAHAAAAAAAHAHVRLQAVYDFHVGDHVVLPRELLEADRTGVVLDVRLVRGDVVPAEVADVCVGTMAYGAPVHVALLHAEVAHRPLGPLVLDLERSLEVALTDLRLPGDQVEYGTAQVLFRHLLLRLRVGVLLRVVHGRRGAGRRRRLPLQRAVLLAKATLEVDANVSR